MSNLWLKQHMTEQKLQKRSPLKHIISRIKHDEFLNLLNNTSCKSMILDVRDDDATGGHIRGALHFPESMWLDSQVINGQVVGNYLLLVLDLIKTKKPDIVVVHCMESAVRGPCCADLLKTYCKDINICILHGGADQFIRKFYKTEFVEDYDNNIWGLDKLEDFEC